MKITGCCIFLLIMSITAFCNANSLVGEQAPQITIKEWITDNPPDLLNQQGAVRVLDFWATWCHSCVAAIPEMIQLCEKYKSQGVQFIALSQDKSADKVRQMARDKGMNYNVAIDDGSVNGFRIRGYPTVVVIDRAGKIIWAGYPWEKGFEKAIASAIK